MKQRITEFTELKAYADIFNERGHRGFKEPLNPFFWWNHKWLGKVDDTVIAYNDNGLIVVLELESLNSKDVNNMLVFSLCPQENVFKRILDIVKDYDTIIFNSEYGDRYRSITRRLDGSSWISNGRFYYAANGRKHGRVKTSDRNL